MQIDWQKQPYFDYLIHAVIMTESGGKHRAVSPVGAQGLMQLMPKTGRELHKKLQYPGPYDPFNIPQNILLGGYYIRKLLEAFEGDVKLALTAYHSGQGRVRKLLTLRKANTLEAIINDLGPVGREYAKKVLSHIEIPLDD